MSDKPLTIEERIAIARRPITVGILATQFAIHREPSMAHAGSGAHPTWPVFNEWGRPVGRRVLSHDHEE